MDDTKLIKTNLTEPDIELFMNLTHYISLVRVMKSSTFGLDLSLLYPFLKFKMQTLAIGAGVRFRAYLHLSSDANFSSFSLAESPPRDLQITAYK